MPKIQESFLHLESKRIFLKFLLEKKIPKIVFILSHLYTTKVVEYTTYVVSYATHVVSYTTFVVYKKSKLGYLKTFLHPKTKGVSCSQMGVIFFATDKQQSKVHRGTSRIKILTHTPSTKLEHQGGTRYI